MIFLFGFAWHVAASFAFLLAILTSNWLTIPTSTVPIQRGIFFVCDLTAQDTISQTTQCVAIFDLDSTSNSTRSNYKIATASSSIAIGCAGLSVIVVWLSGIYFNVRKKNKCTSCFLIITAILLFLTFCTSAAVWILMISETLSLGYTVNRSIFNWPMWLAVGATGGFLVAFIIYMISFCKTVCSRRKRDQSLYYAGNHY